MKLQFGRTGAMAVALLLAGVSVCSAQINPFRSSSRATGLTNADVGMLFTTAGLVNKNEPVKVGDTQDWSNPTSGNSGKVTVTRLFHYSGMECHSLRYDLTFKASNAPRTYNVDWCKTKTGEWKIKS
nr:RT0821/Lpp0805 family surface protein [uncultured Rhodopila sp.]